MEPVGYRHVPAKYGDHLDALGYYNGFLYDSMQNKHGVIIINVKKFGQGFNYIRIEEDRENILPWCANNSWNGYLYTSYLADDNEPDSTQVFGYDLFQPARFKDILHFGRYVS